MVVHYPETVNCDSSVMNSQIDGKAFWAIICARKEVEERLMVNTWLVAIKHNNRLQICQDVNDVIRIARRSERFEGVDCEGLLDHQDSPDYHPKALYDMSFTVKRNSTPKDNGIEASHAVKRSIVLQRFHL